MFVHGFCCSHEDWLLQIDAFKRCCEIVACDLRGHGLTPGEPFECSIGHFGGDVAALVSNLELQEVVLIGHSMGCRVVLEAARLAPERVAGIVLIDGSRQGSGDPDAAEAAARAAIDKTGYRAFAESLFRQMFFSPSALAEAVVQRALQRPEAMGAALWPRMARWDAAEGDAALRAVRCPLLAIQSTTRDPLTLKRAPLKPGESSPWLDIVRDNLPRARIEVLAGVGHFPQLEAPGAVNRLIETFVNRLS